VLLLTPLGSPVALPGACCSGRAASSPEFKLPRPPPGKPCRARVPARSPSQWVHVAPPLGHTEALCATHCSVESVSVLDFTVPRPCCPCAAAAARRRPLRPSYHRQALRGEPNRSPPSLVATPCFTSPPAGSPSPPGSREGNRGYGCEYSKTSRDPSTKKILPL
jgi:hypothetical protein